MTDNSATQAQAIALVLAYERERAAGDEAKLAKIKRAAAGSGYDVDSFDRKIEVKSTEGKDVSEGLVLNSKKEFEHLEKDPQAVIYRVLDVFGQPSLVTLRMSDITIAEEYRARVRAKDPKNARASAIDLSRFKT